MGVSCHGLPPLCKTYIELTSDLAMTERRLAAWKAAAEFELGKHAWPDGLAELMDKAYELDAGT